jgi:5-methylthioadenosine/S-adenosylhomocysteine deaminase
VGLGTGRSRGFSNNDFNMLEEMDLAAKLAEGTLGNPQALPAARRSRWLTIMGARALGWRKRSVLSNPASART